jgi:ribonuclease R
LLTAVGLTLEGGVQPASKHFAKVLEDAQGRDDENIIKTVVLRTMKQAVYTPANEGHLKFYQPWYKSNERVKT